MFFSISFPPDIYTEGQWVFVCFLKWGEKITKINMRMFLCRGTISIGNKVGQSDQLC